MSHVTHARSKHVLALAFAVALGFLSRTHETGLYVLDKSAGDILYAVAAYLCLAFVFPRWRVRSVASVALLACWTIEVFQATGIPAKHAESAFVRWFVGTTFSWHDMACYPVGVAVIAALDRRCLRREGAAACSASVPIGTGRVE